MDTLLKKLNEELREKLVKVFEGEDYKNFVSQVKDASEDDCGRFKIIISTDDEDRQGEIVDQKGLDTSFYEQNSIVLYGHDYKALPIGLTDKIYKEGNKTIAEGKFAPESANPFAQQCRRLYDLGMLNTASIGFIAKKMEGNRIVESELLEWSFVSVPANAGARRLSFDKAKELGLDAELMKTKGFEFEEKEDVGDALDERDQRKKKWENFEKVDAVMSALYEVYFADDTPVENFNDLLNETIGLLQKIASGDAAKEGKIFEASKVETLERIFKSFREKDDDNIQTQIGAEMTALQSIIDNAVIEASKKILEIAGGDNTGNEPNGDEPPADEGKGMKSGRVLSDKNKKSIESVVKQMTDVVGALKDLLQSTEVESEKGVEKPSERSGAVELDEKLLMNGFLTAKKALQDVSTSVGDKLGEINKIINKNK
ncbi:MAG: hypothetical protein WC472_01575 [Candidatus Paceibacterota bacterium]